MQKDKRGKKLYTSKETREWLKISERTLYRYVKAGILKPIRLGGTKQAGRLLFPESQIFKLLS